MFGFLVLFNAFTAEPGLAAHSSGGGKSTISTCACPMPKLIARVGDHASDFRKAVYEPVDWLRKWERAMRDAPDPDRSHREEFRQSVHVEFNQHTAIAAEQFVGRIDADQLIENFEWTVSRQPGESVSLEATPRDETEQLFYGSFRVWMSADDGVLERIVAVGRNRKQRTIWQPETAATFPEIRFASFEDRIPPAPKSLVRTAAARLD